MREIRWPQIIWTILSMALAIVLLGLFVQFIDGEQIIATLKKVNLFFYLLIIVSSFIHLNLGALKWKLVIKTINPNFLDEVPYQFFLYYTSLGALIGQLLPIHISTPLARSIGTRSMKKALSVGALTSFYEQGFDVLVLCLLAVPSLVVIKLNLSFSVWLVSSMLSLLGAGSMLSLVVKPTMLWAGKISRKINWKLKLWNQLKSYIIELEQSSIIESRITTQLFLLASVRYLNLAIRVIIIYFGTGISIPFEVILYSMPLVNLSSILSITPSNLGITEWTFTGLFVFQGIMLNDAMTFSLASRALQMSSLIGVSFMIALLFFIGNVVRDERKHRL